VEVLRTLARLYQSKGAAAEHLEILERLLVSRLPIEIASICCVPSRGCCRGLWAGARGDGTWREILKLSPHEADALAEMERLLDDSDISLRFAAAETLEPIYRASGDGPRLARVLRVFIELAEDAGREPVTGLAWPRSRRTSWATSKPPCTPGRGHS